MISMKRARYENVQTLDNELRVIINYDPPHGSDSPLGYDGGTASTSHDHDRSRDVLVTHQNTDYSFRVTSSSKSVSRR